MEPSEPVQACNGIALPFIIIVLRVTYVACRLKVGHAVVQLVEALRYKPERRGFDYRWSYWDFS